MGQFKHLLLSILFFLTQTGDRKSGGKLQFLSIFIIFDKLRKQLSLSHNTHPNLPVLKFLQGATTVALRRFCS